MPTIASMKQFNTEPERGQVLIVVVMMMVIVLTIGLSLATRSLTNVRQTAEEDNSQRAFSAAEAGINRVLQENAIVNGTSEVLAPNFAKDTSYKTVIKSERLPLLTLNGGNKLGVNESVDVWLSQYPDYTNRWNGYLTLHFAEDSDTQCEDIPAFDITILSGSATDPTLTHHAVDPCNNERGNNFSNEDISSGEELDGISYKYKLRLNVAQPGFFMRIIPLYAATRLAVKAENQSTPFPIQGRVIESTGISGETQRKIVVVQENPKLPLEMFPFSLYTPSSL